MIRDEKLIIAICIIAIVTFSTRAFPFVLFGSAKRNPPAIVTFLGKYLPPAIICIILVYCFCDVKILEWPFAIKEIICIAVIAVLHLWKNNAMISIFSGTILYMIFTQFVFNTVS